MREINSYLKIVRLGGFTLFELLVVIALVMILLAIALPAYLRSKQKARGIMNMNSQRLIVMAVTNFAIDNNGRYPDSVATIGQSERNWNWQEPTMITSIQPREPGLHRAMSKYLGSYVEDVNIMFCSNAPRGYEFLKEAWQAGDNWDNPHTIPKYDPVIGTYCFYWNYIGWLETKDKLFMGPKKLGAGGGESYLLVSDYFGYDHWRNPNDYGSCERFKGTRVVRGTQVSSDFWSLGQSANDIDLDKLTIRLNAGFVDGHVESYRPCETIPMKISITSDGKTPYPKGFGPGIFFLPENALD